MLWKGQKDVFLTGSPFRHQCARVFGLGRMFIWVTPPPPNTQTHIYIYIYISISIYIYLYAYIRLRVTLRFVTSAPESFAWEEINTCKYIGLTTGGVQ